MVTYMNSPQNRVTVGSTNYDNTAVSCSVTRFENGFDVASVTFLDPKAVQRATIAKDATIQIQIKDQHESTYTNLLTGVIRYTQESLKPEAIRAKADANGYMLAECPVAQEYGTDSSNPAVDTLEEIIEDAGVGIVPKYVLKILNTAANTGYSLDTTKVATVAGTIPHLYFPYKPASKCLADICAIVQALTGGCHWIVTTEAGTNYLRLKEVGNTQVGWTLWYGDSEANATLTQGVDFVEFNPESMSAEANYVLYHGHLRKPVDGDKWTEGNFALWGSSFGAVTDEAVIYKIGLQSAQWDPNNAAGDLCYYPAARDLSWDITTIGGKFNIPTLSFWLYNDVANPQSFHVRMYSAVGGLAGYFGLNTLITPTFQTWVHYKIPIGPYANRSGADELYWLPTVIAGAPSWSDIDDISFWTTAAAGQLYIDGLCIDGWILRAAYDTDLITADKLKMRVINDPFPKDDSLIAADDSGTAALLAYSEFLRLSSEPSVGTLTTRMIKDLLPGQRVHIHARPNSGGTWQIDATYRVTQLVHRFSKDGYFTDMTVTSDVTNGYTRAAFDSMNEIYKNARPEFQDKQTTGIKMRDVDITQPILEVDY